MELGSLGGIRRITRPVSPSRLCDERQELRREGKESLQERSGADLFRPPVCAAGEAVLIRRERV